MQTLTFIDSGLMNELKNWMICKRLVIQGEEPHSFMVQTRRYLMNLQKLKRDHNGRPSYR